MIRTAWFLIIALLGVCLFAWADDGSPENAAPSILNPNGGSGKTEYRMHIDAIDPTPQTNPKGANSPGYRGTNQLVIYTSAFGETTQTRGNGLEAVVINDRIKDMNTASNTIPYQGFVISGQGQAGQWMQRVLKLDATVELDRINQRIVVRMTPEVYLSSVKQAIQQAERNRRSDDLRYHELLSQARACYQQMQSLAPQGVTPQLKALSDTCTVMANKAFYRSVSSFPHAFKGVWVRPTEKSPEAIQEAIAQLKAANIKHIFLETYYEGRTIYPSQVMAQYGLPRQHTQFEGWDPLKAWINAARENDLKVHAWVQTFYAGNMRSTIEPHGPILQKYPQWTNVQRTAVDKPTPIPSSIEDGHLFLDPANPEVRGFLEKLILEITSTYQVDGLNLDYIRYPSSARTTTPGFINTTWGYTAVARKTFMEMLEQERLEAEEKRKEEEAQRIEELKKAGKPIPKPKPEPKAKVKENEPSTDPKDLVLNDPLWERWVEWRKEQVSSFVKNISQKVRENNPAISVSAVVFHKRDPLYQVKLQDWPRWVSQGWVQALTPIGLGGTSDEIYTRSLEFKRVTEGKAPVYVGIFAMYNRQDPVELLSQIQAVHRAGLPGVVLFERSRLDKDYREALLEGAFRD
jgi:uncharacterized lipoprotein YddW (UPF0748 family)